MMRKSLIAALGVMGLVAAGTMVSATPASAGYACGPWNGWCSFYVKPGWGWHGGGYYGKRYYGGRYYGHRYGNKKYYRGGKKKHAHKRSNRRHWR